MSLRGKTHVRYFSSVKKVIFLRVIFLPELLDIGAQKRTRCNLRSVGCGRAPQQEYRQEKYCEVVHVWLVFRLVSIVIGPTFVSAVVGPESIPKIARVPTIQNIAISVKSIEVF